MSTKLEVLDKPSMQVFDELESEVRSYCRSFTTVFEKARGYHLWDEAGNQYIDFFAGAGTLNYGHNNERMKKQIIQYIQNDGITHSLDMATTAKEHFLLALDNIILQPRNMHYKVMFPGPTGTNAVESALKIARKVTGRETVISFTNAFHGMSLGSLAVTGNKMKRGGGGVPLSHSVFMPYDGYFGEELDTTAYLERYLDDGGSGVETPAAIILETVQGEGGLNAASDEWLRSIERICRKRGILLIVDDIQMGCGRTGTFFSFESSGISPDVICLSKSLGGFGLPMAITLIKPELDIWEPGEHNGTFRGNNLGFVAATEALEYWKEGQFAEQIQHKSEVIETALQSIVKKYPELQGKVLGKGMIQGIRFDRPGLAEKICAEAFERGLIMETSGASSEVMKLLPPLTINMQGLNEGLYIIEQSVRAVQERIVK